MTNLRSSGTFCSDGVETSTANQIIEFQYPLISFYFTTINASAKIRINGETRSNGQPNWHYIPQGKSLNITDMTIRKIEILEAGVQYLYEAQYY